MAHLTNETLPSDNPDLLPFQGKFRRSTIRKVSDLRRAFNASNRTDAIARAIRLAWMIVQEIQNGSTIECHRRDGSVKDLVLVEVD